jgi:hypothetical protein
MPDRKTEIEFAYGATARMIEDKSRSWLQSVLDSVTDLGYDSIVVRDDYGDDYQVQFWIGSDRGNYAHCFFVRIPKRDVLSQSVTTYRPWMATIAHRRAVSFARGLTR